MNTVPIKFLELCYRMISNSFNWQLLPAPFAKIDSNESLRQTSLGVSLYINPRTLEMELEWGTSGLRENVLDLTTLCKTTNDFREFFLGVYSFSKIECSGNSTPRVRKCNWNDNELRRLLYLSRLFPFVNFMDGRSKDVETKRLYALLRETHFYCNSSLRFRAFFGSEEIRFLKEQLDHAPVEAITVPYAFEEQAFGICSLYSGKITVYGGNS